MKLITSHETDLLDRKVTVEMSILELASLYAYVGNTKVHELLLEMKSEAQFDDEEITERVMKFIDKESFMFEELGDLLETLGVEC